MRKDHLTERELDALLVGEGLPPGAREHLEDCLTCRSRRDRFLAAVRAARESGVPRPLPGTTLARALATQDPASGAGSRPLWRLAAAAVVLLALLVLWDQMPREGEEPFDPDAVLAEVDETLARDPVAAVFSDELVEWVLPPEETSNGGNTL